MPVANIVQYLEDKGATKRPAWAGYVRRDNTTNTEGELVSYKVTIVRRNGDQYVFEHNEETDEWTYLGKIEHTGTNTLGTGAPVPGTDLEMEKELFEGTMIASDWIQGEAEEFEKARSGVGIY